MKVFISYAKEDIETARKLYHDLKQAGISTWMDKEDLLPGQDWKTEVSRAIRTSSYFIALLSTRSISKQGFFQTELKKAIDVLDTFPEHRIYFIPVRIDNCDPGYERLQNIYWADLFPSYQEGLSQILRVLAPTTMPKEKPITKPEIQKLKYPFRKEPITVSSEEASKVFSLKQDSDGWWRPLNYIENDFKDNGNGTITDHATGLTWQKSGSPDYLYYKDSSGYIEGLNRNKFAGHSDWRLPTVDELKSLLMPKKQSNNIYISLIFNEKQRWCWTSDKRTSGGMWRVNFDLGSVSCYHDLNYVRAVRSIQ